MCMEITSKGMTKNSLDKSYYYYFTNQQRRQLGGHPLSTYANFSEKLTFPTPRYAHVRVRIRGVRNVSFSDNFAYVLN